VKSFLNLRRLFSFNKTTNREAVRTVLNAKHVTTSPHIETAHRAHGSGCGKVPIVLKEQSK
jgi:hypothetical protein